MGPSRMNGGFPLRGSPPKERGTLSWMGCYVTSNLSVCPERRSSAPGVLPSPSALMVSSGSDVRASILAPCPNVRPLHTVTGPWARRRCTLGCRRPRPACAAAASGGCESPGDVPGLVLPHARCSRCWWVSASAGVRPRVHGAGRTQLPQVTPAHPPDSPTPVRSLWSDRLAPGFRGCHSDRPGSPPQGRLYPGRRFCGREGLDHVVHRLRLEGPRDGVLRP